MKKVLAIFAVLVLTASFAFADGKNWTGGPSSGYFTAKVLCTPNVGPVSDNGGEVTIPLGNFFIPATGTANYGVSGTLDWKLNGPVEATYHITFGDSKLPADGGCTLDGNWLVNGLTPSTDGYYNFETITCSGQGFIPITFTATTLNVPAGETSGTSYTFTRTVTVSVSL